MWSNQKSLKIAVPQALAFEPPYCANPKCLWHKPTDAMRFHRHGAYKINRYPYISPRFRCALCLKVFTSSFFQLSYRDQIQNNYEEIADLRLKGVSKRQIALFLDCSLDSVQRKIQKMARWALLILAKDMQDFPISESIAYDGLENFSFSQFDPNNINHAVGRDSLFVYDFNFCHLNRKGRMSEYQKRKKKSLEKIHGKYPVKAIELCSERIFQRLCTKTPLLVLHTDNHFFYRSALERVRARVHHLITPAKIGRTYRNRLFAINHMDMLTRHHLSDFKRETIAFAKTSQSMVESFILFAAHKNYMRPKFVKKHKHDPQTNKISPAIHLGIRKKIQSFSEFFKVRVTKAQVQLNSDWKNFIERKDIYSRRPIRAYNGI